MISLKLEQLILVLLTGLTKYNQTKHVFGSRILMEKSLDLPLGSGDLIEKPL